MPESIIADIESLTAKEAEKKLANISEYNFYRINLIISALKYYNLLNKKEIEIIEYQQSRLWWRITV